MTMTLITNTFVLVAADCPVTAAEVPVGRGSTPTVPVLQHELLIARPYSLTLEDLMFEIHVRRAGLSAAEAKKQAAAIHALLFGKPWPCMRASALPKRYGWGVHHDAAGKLALVPMQSAEYRRFADGKVKGVEVVPAMRSKRA